MGFLDPFGDADGVFEKPLALASLWEEFALTRATLSCSQADLVLFLITKRVHEPSIMSNHISEALFWKYPKLVGIKIRHISSPFCPSDAYLPFLADL